MSACPGCARALQVERELRTRVAELERVLLAVTVHFEAVMGGPLMQAAGVKFANGVPGIPTIALARRTLGDTPPEGGPPT